jgi:hypothetical protein
MFKSYDRFFTVFFAPFSFLEHRTYRCTWSYKLFLISFVAIVGFLVKFIVVSHNKTRIRRDSLYFTENRCQKRTCQRDTYSVKYPVECVKYLFLIKSLVARRIFWLISMSSTQKRVPKKQQHCRELRREYGPWNEKQCIFLIIWTLTNVGLKKCHDRDEIYFRKKSINARWSSKLFLKCVGNIVYFSFYLRALLSKHRSVSSYLPFWS